MQRWSDGFTNAFLLVYAADGTVSLLDELLRLATGQTLLLPLRNAVALPVFFVAFLAIPFLALSPRLPVRLLLPLFVSTIWLNDGAAPLPLWLEGPALGLAAAGIQLAFAALAYAFVRHRRGGWVWFAAPGTPAFGWGHWARTTALIGAVLIPAAALYGVVLFATSLQVGTRGFVSFDRSGVQLDDRRYTKGDREIRLVGMMHIGEQDAYREVVSSFGGESTVVLEEGLTDEDRRLQEPLAYDGVAGFLGLDTQDDLATYLEDPETHELPEWPVLRNADVDLAAFAPATIAWLEQTRDAWASGRVVPAMREAMRLSAEHPELLSAVEHDVFELRNQHLLAEIDTALREYRRVVVPWGALHLPTIEAAILEQGFELRSHQRRRLVSWGTLRDALF